jgi:hypothetical protein
MSGESRCHHRPMLAAVELDIRSNYYLMKYDTTRVDLVWRHARCTEWVPSCSSTRQVYEGSQQPVNFCLIADEERRP